MDCLFDKLGNSISYTFKDNTVVVYVQNCQIPVVYQPYFFIKLSTLT
jgi:hypothetical protein